MSQGEMQTSARSLFDFIVPLLLFNFIFVEQAANRGLKTLLFVILRMFLTVETGIMSMTKRKSTKCLIPKIVFQFQFFKSKNIHILDELFFPEAAVIVTDTESHHPDANSANQ